jgi:hypothetical protein
MHKPTICFINVVIDFDVLMVEGNQYEYVDYKHTIQAK